MPYSACVLVQLLHQTHSSPCSAALSIADAVQSRRDSQNPDYVSNNNFRSSSQPSPWLHLQQHQPLNLSSAAGALAPHQEVTSLRAQHTKSPSVPETVATRRVWHNGQVNMCAAPFNAASLPNMEAKANRNETGETFIVFFVIEHMYSS